MLAKTLYEKLIETHTVRELDKEGHCRFNLSMQHPFQLSLSVF